MFGEEQSGEEYNAVSEGQYNVVFDNATLDETGNYSCINAQFTIVGPTFKQRKLWKRFYFSDGTAKKFLPWQFSILGIKEELSAKEINSHEDSARAALELMGTVFGDAFVAEVSINDKGYNDLVLIKAGHDEIAAMPKIKAQETKGLPNMVPTFDDNEEISF